MSASLLSRITSLFTLSDEQAMGRVQMHDDAQAFAQLLNRWERPIQRLCIRMLGDEHRAEDVAQETFARVYAKRKEYKADARFSTFLWRIAMNLCYDELRRQRRRNETPFDEPSIDGFESADAMSEAGAPDQVASGNERAELVRDAVMRLPEAYRSVVVLRHYENLKFREIADVLEIPEGTVKSRMAEAMSILSRLLHPELRDGAGAPRSRNRTPEKLLL